MPMSAQGKRQKIINEAGQDIMTVVTTDWRVATWLLLLSMSYLTTYIFTVSECMGVVTVIGTENEISGQSSNSARSCCIHQGKVLIHVHFQLRVK